MDHTPRDTPDAYDRLYERFSEMSARHRLGVADEHLLLASFIALDELLARLPECGELTPPVPAIWHPLLPPATAENVERALGLAATQLVRLVPPSDAPPEIGWAYRVADALLATMWAETTVH